MLIVRLEVRNDDVAEFSLKLFKRQLIYWLPPIEPVPLNFQ